MAVLSRGIAIQRIACGRRRKHHLIWIEDLQVSMMELSVLMSPILLLPIQVIFLSEGFRDQILEF